jgi:hypothetical protein
MRRRLAGPEIRLIIALCVVVVFFVNHKDQGGDICGFLMCEGYGFITFRNNTYCVCTFFVNLKEGGGIGEIFDVAKHESHVMPIDNGHYIVKAVVTDTKEKRHNIFTQNIQIKSGDKKEVVVNKTTMNVPADCR